MFLTFMELTLKIVTRNDFFFNLANVLLLLTLWLWPLTCYIEKLIKSGHYHYQLWSIQCIFGFRIHHYNDVIMSLIASQISSLTIVYSTFYSGADQRKHQSASLASVRGIQRAGEFPAQRASNAENISIWWRHHDTVYAKPIQAETRKNRQNSQSLNFDKRNSCRTTLQKEFPCQMLLIWLLKCGQKVLKMTQIITFSDVVTLNFWPMSLKQI